MKPTFLLPVFESNQPFIPSTLPNSTFLLGGLDCRAILEWVVQKVFLWAVIFKEEIKASRYGRILILKKQKGKWQKEFEQ